LNPENIPAHSSRLELIQNLDRRLNINARQAFKKSLLLVEINNFLTIDKQYGVATGIRFCSKVVTNLKSILRNDDLFFVLQENRIAIFLDPIASEDIVLLAIDKLIRITDEGLCIDKTKIKARLKIGAVIFPDTANTGTRLLQCAEKALEYTIDRGQTYSFFDPSFDQAFEKEYLLAEDLAESIKRNELFLLYQPQLCLQTQSISGFEVLARWHNHKHGFISPEIFFPIAEKTDTTRVLSEWVVNTALRQSRELLEQHPDISVSINVSSSLLDDYQFVEFIGRAIKLWSIPASNLVLEITESVMMNNVDHTIGILNTLKNIGAKISIDDFGTGFSSLNYLNRLPIDELKIDKSFLMGLSVGSENWNIVQLVADLAHRFKLEVVGEGVESEAILTNIKKLGVNRAQGYQIGKAMPINDLISIIEKYKNH